MDYQPLIVLLRSIISFILSAGILTTSFAESEPLFPSVSIEQVRQLQEERVLLIDTRPTLFFEIGHIPGAVSLSNKDFERDFTKLKDQLETLQKAEGKFILYCTSNYCDDSDQAALKLAEKGFLNILLFKGGWQAWEQADLPVESSY